MGNGVPRWRNPDPPWWQSEKITIYDIPQIGTWVGRVGHIVDVISTPCSGADAEIWLLAAWYGVPRLLITLTKPDSLDLVSQRWGGSHKRRRKKKFTILEAIQPKEGLGGPPGTMWWAGFALKDWAERVGWYMLVVDATTSFAVHWTSTAYQFAGCKTPNAPYCVMDGHQAVYGPFAAGTYSANMWEVRNERVFAGDPDSIVTPAGYDTAAGVAFSTAPLALPFQEASVSSIEIYDQAHDRVLATTPTHEGYDGKTVAQAISRDWGVGLFAHDYQFRYTKSEGFFRLGPSQFWCYGDKSLGMNADP